MESLIIEEFKILCYIYLYKKITMSSDNKEEEVYNIVSGLVGFKFKVQLDGSGVRFKEILKVKNLRTDKEYYSLFINEDDALFFTDTESFISQFIAFLNKSIDQLDKEIEDLNHPDNRPMDSYSLFLMNEDLGVHSCKQVKLIEKLEKVQEKLNGQKSV